VTRTLPVEPGGVAANAVHAGRKSVWRSALAFGPIVSASCRCRNPELALNVDEPADCRLVTDIFTQTAS
jgi:hypothetical protein